MLTLEEAKALWRQVPDNCRRLVTQMLAGELTRLASEEMHHSRPEEYNAFQVAHWFLWSALGGGNIYLNENDAICVEGDLDGPTGLGGLSSEEKLNRFFKSLPHGKYLVLTEGVVLSPGSIDL